MPREMKPAPVTHHDHPSSFFSLLSGWVQQGVESFFASQRILLDLAMRQNAMAMKSLREGLANPEHSPVAILTELAIEGTSSFVEAQRILLSLVQQENEILMNGAKERMGGSAPAVASADMVRRSIDTFLDMEHEFLSITSKQTMEWLESMRKGRYPGPHMVDLAREAMDTFVHTQKKFLDIIAQETARMTSGKPEKTAKKTEVAKLAREASHAFIEAQKKLLDVAGQQMNVNLQAATKTMEMLSPARLLPMANITGEGVKSFVDAEKALMESMVKHAPAKPAAKRRRKMAKAAHAAA